MRRANPSWPGLGEIPPSLLFSTINFILRLSEILSRPHASDRTSNFPHKCKDPGWLAWRAVHANILL
jgi:hypothetical protein